MNNQAIRTQLDNIQLVYGNRLSDIISENVKIVDFWQNRIKTNHSHKNSINNYSNLTPEFLQKRIPTLEEVLDETKSETPYLSKKKKFVQNYGDLCILESRIAFQQNNMDFIDPRLSESKLHRKRISDVIPEIFSSTEKLLFYRGLKHFGMDFELISTVYLPQRSSKEIHGYFRCQDRRNHLRIDHTLK